MKAGSVIRNYYVLPCLLLLLNLVNSVISYKAGLIRSPLQRTAVVILLVLCGSTVTAFLLAPVFEKLARTLHRSSRSSAGIFGEVIFLFCLGAVVFWLYYRLTTHGVTALLPPAWHNPRVP